MSVLRRTALLIAGLATALAAVVALPLGASTASAQSVPVGTQYSHDPIAAHFTRSDVPIYKCERPVCGVIAHGQPADRVSVSCWTQDLGGMDFTPYRYGLTLHYNDSARKLYGWAASADVQLLDGPVSHCTGSVGVRPNPENR